jgi:glycosyltransferase involved in cell wall biosynthesis
MKVSVVIVTYNHGKYVQQAIESVVSQKVTFPFEIIVADDKSTDETVAIVKKFQQKHPELIKPIFREENIGTTRNICDAFKRCKGEYLIGFGGDDYWIDSDKLQIQADWLDCHPEYVAVSHVLEWRNNSGIVLKRSPSARLIGKEASSDLFLRGYYFPTSTTMFRNIFNSEKSDSFIRLITTSRLVEDISLAMILLDTGMIHIMDRCMAVYRKNYGTNDSNYNSTRNFVQTFQDHIEIYDANNRFFSNKYDFSRLYADKAVKSFIWSILNHKVKLFYAQYKKIPLKAKFFSFTLFPVIVFKSLRKS